jgi:hypothetical protein
MEDVHRHERQTVRSFRFVFVVRGNAQHVFFHTSYTSSTIMLWSVLSALSALFLVKRVLGFLIARRVSESVYLLRRGCG